MLRSYLRLRPRVDAHVVCAGETKTKISCISLLAATNLDLVFPDEDQSSEFTVAH